MDEWRAGRTRGVAFAVTCPRCGGESPRLVNQTSAGEKNATSQLVGVLECSDCKRQYTLTVFLRTHQALTPEQRNANERAKRRRQKAAS